MIHMQCSNCGDTYKFKEDKRGKKMKCKACGTVNLIGQAANRIKGEIKEGHSTRRKKQENNGSNLLLFWGMGVVGAIVLVGGIAFVAIGMYTSEKTKDGDSKTAAEKSTDSQAGKSNHETAEQRTVPKYSFEFPTFDKKIGYLGPQIIVSQDSKYLATTYLHDYRSKENNSNLFVWNLSDGKSKHQLKLPEDHGAVGITFLDGGRKILAIGRSRVSMKVFFWDVESGKLIQQYPVPAMPMSLNGIVFSPDGATLIASGSSSKGRGDTGPVLLIDLPTGQCLSNSYTLTKPQLYCSSGLLQQKHDVYLPSVGSVRFLDQAGTKVVTRSSELKVQAGTKKQIAVDTHKIWDLTNGKDLTSEYQISLKNLSGWISVGDGQHVAAREKGSSDEIKMINLMTGKTKSALRVKGNPIALSQDSRFLVVGSWDQKSLAGKTSPVNILSMSIWDTQ